MAKTLQLKTLLALALSVHGVSSIAVPVESANINHQEPEWPQELDSSFHDSSWPGFVEQTSRWSSYRAPSFDGVFIPTSPEELAEGVRAFIHIKSGTEADFPIDCVHDK
jgi:fumiquinazoline A oxidase